MLTFVVLPIIKSTLFKNEYENVLFRINPLKSQNYFYIRVLV